jgi:hypothetical protein
VWRPGRCPEGAENRGQRRKACITAIPTGRRHHLARPRVKHRAISQRSLPMPGAHFAGFPVYPGPHPAERKSIRSLREATLILPLLRRPPRIVCRSFLSTSSEVNQHWRRTTKVVRCGTVPMRRRRPVRFLSISPSTGGANFPHRRVFAPHAPPDEANGAEFLRNIQPKRRIALDMAFRGATVRADCQCPRHSALTSGQSAEPRSSR